MKNETKKILQWIPSIILAVLITGGAAFKCSGTEALVLHYTQLGLLAYVKLFAVAELIFTALFLFPGTMKIGFLLLTAYLGGAMAVELSHEYTFVPPMVLLAIVWFAAYCRQYEFFVRKQRNPLHPVTFI